MSSSYDIPRIGKDKCNMKCPIGKDMCGGKLAMDIFYTGVKVKREKQVPETVDQVRVVFILTVSGKTFPAKDTSLIINFLRKGCETSEATSSSNIPSPPFLLYPCGREQQLDVHSVKRPGVSAKHKAGKSEVQDLLGQ